MDQPRDERGDEEGGGKTNDVYIRGTQCRETNKSLK